MTRRLTPKEQVDIVYAYSVDLIPMITLAEQYARSRQGIYKVLIKHGIDPKAHQRLEVSCSTCGTIISRPRCQIRNKYNNFCNNTCYGVYIAAGSTPVNGNDRRKGSRRARRIVNDIFPLEDRHIVHHEDHNPLNNQLHNLRVFATSGDHCRYHRTGPGYVRPIWDGSLV